jgi:hypothetical protein
VPPVAAPLPVAALLPVARPAAATGAATGSAVLPVARPGLVLPVADRSRINSLAFVAESGFSTDVVVLKFSHVVANRSIDHYSSGWYIRSFFSGYLC